MELMELMERVHSYAFNTGNATPYNFKFGIYQVPGPGGIFLNQASGFRNMW